MNIKPYHKDFYLYSLQEVIIKDENGTPITTTFEYRPVSYFFAEEIFESLYRKYRAVDKGVDGGNR